MNVRSLLMGCALAMVAVAVQAQSEPFTMQLPPGFAPFTKSTQNAQSKDGTIETTTWLSKNPNGSAIVVSVSKLPKKILAPVKLLDGTRDSLVKSTSSTLETDEVVSTDPPTRRMTMHSDAAWVRARLVAKTERLYQLIFIGRSADARTAAPVSAMFDGFRVD